MFLHTINHYFNFLGMLVRVLESDWAVLSEEIGLWIPIEVTNQEHDDKPDGQEDIGNIKLLWSRFFFHLNLVAPHYPVLNPCS